MYLNELTARKLNKYSNPNNNSLQNQSPKLNDWNLTDHKDISHILLNDFLVGQYKPRPASQWAATLWHRDVHIIFETTNGVADALFIEPVAALGLLHLG